MHISPLAVTLCSARAIQETGGRLANGLGVLWRTRFVFAEVGEAGEGDGDGFGLGLHELAPGAGDIFDGLLCERKLLGVDDGAELGKREVVVVAQVECADGGVEEILEQVVCEGWFAAWFGERFGGWIGGWMWCCVHHHGGIVA